MQRVDDMIGICCVIAELEQSIRFVDKQEQKAFKRLPVWQVAQKRRVEEFFFEVFMSHLKTLARPKRLLVTFLFNFDTARE